MARQDWGVSIPVYVTRPTAQGDVGIFSLSGWAYAVFMLLVTINAFLWGIVGIVEAVRYFV